MPKYQYGCSRAQEGVMDPITGAITGLKEIEIYQDTIVLDEPEAQTTDHFKQGDPDPKVTRYSRVVTSVIFSVMDMGADSKVNWLGGTKTTVNTKDTWNKPKKKVNEKMKALIFDLEDGSVITIPNAGCAGRLTANLNDTDIALIPIKATVKSTGVEEVSSFQWTD